MTTIVITDGSRVLVTIDVARITQRESHE